MDSTDSKARRHAVYSPKACAFCGELFTPVTSKPKTCSWQCRFKLIQKGFEGQQGCWEWPQSLNKQTGYGQFHADFGGSRNQTAHRVSHLLNIGPVGEGLDVMHSCDNRSCFNPAHLSAGTRAENLLDMRQKGRADYSVRRRLDAHTNSKLTSQAVLEIRGSSDSDAVLATRYGVSKTAVNMARRRLTWKTLPSAQQSA